MVIRYFSCCLILLWLIQHANAHLIPKVRDKTPKVRDRGPHSHRCNETLSYPVLYLLHGVGDNEYSWEVNGKISANLNELAEDEQINPVIVVMPFGFIKQDLKLTRQFPAKGDFAQYFSDVVRTIENEDREQQEKGSRGETVRTHRRETKISDRGNILIFDKGVDLDLRSEAFSKSMTRCQSIFMACSPLS
jgi:hypothetical protein